MTFTAQAAQADLYACAGAIRDNITSATNWTLVADQVDTLDSNSRGGYFVATCPMGWDWLFGWRPLNNDLGGSSIGYLWSEDSYWMGNNEEFGLAYGRWDGTDERMGYATDDNGNQVGSRYTDGDWADNSQLSANDDLELTMQYGGDAWCFYVRRTMGDGYNNDGWVGYAPIDKMWDYTQLADASLREFIYGFNAGGDDNTYTSGWRNFSRFYYEYGGNAVNYTGSCHLNPDSEVNNFPWIENILLSTSVRNTDTDAGLPIGTFNTWLEELSGSDTTLGDTVQDSDGNDVYMVCKQYSSTPVAIRMD